MPKTGFKLPFKKLIGLGILLGFILSIGGNMPVMGTPEAPKSVDIYVVTRHDSGLYRTVQDAFLESSYKPADLDVKLIFQTQGISVWPTIIDAGDTYLAWGGGPTLFDNLLANDLLLPITDEDILSTLSDLRKNEWEDDTIAGSAMFRNGTGSASDDVYWIGSAIASFGFTVCKAVLKQVDKEIPRSWNALAHPFYFDENPLIAIGSAAESTSNTRIYEIILQKFGWQLGWGILSMIGGNSLITSGSTGAKRAVEECNVGIANTIDFYGFDAEIEGDNNLYILPDNQSIVNSDPIAFTKNDGDPDKMRAAQAFMDYVLSAEGQGVLLHNNIKRMPIRADAFEATPSTDDFSNTEKLEELYGRTLNNTGITFDESLSLSYLSSMIYHWEAVVHDAHNALHDVMKSAQTAWKDKGMTSTQLMKLAYALGDPVGDPEFTQSHAQSINDQMETDEAFRVEKQGDWKSAANSKYEDIKSELDSLTTATDFGVSDADIADLEDLWAGYAPGGYDGPEITEVVDSTGTGDTSSSITKGVPGFELIAVFSSMLFLTPMISAVRKRRR